MLQIDRDSKNVRSMLSLRNELKSFLYKTFTIDCHLASYTCRDHVALVDNPKVLTQMARQGYTTAHCI